MQAPPPEHAADARRRAAVALLDSRRAALQRTARRFSLCADDADDSFQRAVEILLTKAPPLEPATLAAWMQVVVRREALAVRRVRERGLGAGGGDAAADGGLDRFACEAPGPQERLEGLERLVRALRLLRCLKPQERRAVVLQAQGFSYAEICEITGWTYTKVNRCLAEGRARLRQLGPAVD